MIRVSKTYCPSWTQVLISGAECNITNIKKVVSLFNFDNAVFSIDSLSSDSAIFTFFSEMGLNRIVTPTSTDSFEFSAMVPKDLVDCFLEKAIDEDPENIFIFHAIDSLTWEQNVQTHPDTLLSKSIADVFIRIARDDQMISISAAKNLYSPQTLTKDLKLLFGIKQKAYDYFQR